VEAGDPAVTGDRLVLSELVRARKSVVLKQIRGSYGKGIRFVQCLEDDRFTINGAPSSAIEVDQLTRDLDKMLVFEFVRQHPVFQQIYPDTTNAVRLLTMWDYETDAPFIACAIARFGTPESFPVDTGGVTAGIDLETGTMLEAIPHRTGERSGIHPVSGEQIEGIRIPGWLEISRSMLSICRALPQLPYVGWDIAVTEGGFQILEGNNRPWLRALQCHTPLLRDPRVRRFFQRFGVL